MATLLQRTKAAWDAFRSPEGKPMVSYRLPENHRERYLLYEAYYESDVYNEVNELTAKYAAQRGVAGLKFLDNPANQGVEFHAAHLFPGTLEKALPIEDASDAVEKAIKQIWAWSNWADEKQVYARWLSMFGDCFIKAASKRDKEGNITRVYMQLLRPDLVTDFEKDERGYITWIRLDYEEEGDRVTWHTEVWNKEEDSFRVWKHDRGPDVKLESLGDPAQNETDRELGEIDTTITSFGIDFVPFVHAKFMDVGKKRGVSVFERYLTPIDEINRAINRLHETYFRYDRPPTVLKRNQSGGGAIDYTQRAAVTETDPNTADEVEVGNEKMWRLPGNASLEQTIPNIPYAAGLEMINDRHQKLAEQMAELRYFQDVEQGDPSGLARLRRLDSAISRAVEGRGNAEATMIRAIQMCLTLASQAKLIQNVGTYENDDFNFTFQERDILHVSRAERFTQDKAEAEVIALWLATKNPALIRRYLKRNGYEEKEITAILKASSETSPEERQRAQIDGILSGNIPIGGNGT